MFAKRNASTKTIGEKRDVIVVGDVFFLPRRHGRGLLLELQALAASPQSHRAVIR